MCVFYMRGNAESQIVDSHCGSFRQHSEEKEEVWTGRNCIVVFGSVTVEHRTVSSLLFIFTVFWGPAKWQSTASSMARMEYWPRYTFENYNFVTPFEKSFDFNGSTKWMQENWIHSITSSIVYVALIYIGQKVVLIRPYFFVPLKFLVHKPAVWFFICHA